MLGSYQCTANNTEGKVGATISVSGEYYRLYLGPTSTLLIILREGLGPPSVLLMSIIAYTWVLPVHCLLREGLRSPSVLLVSIIVYAWVLLVHCY